jgi:polyphosphate kinase
MDTQDIHAFPSPYINREASWIAFNERVLEEAENPQHPLLERLRFLAISHSNLEEFYQVRVAGLKAQVRAVMNPLSQDGLTPTEQLNDIYARTRSIISKQQKTWLTLNKELRDNGVHIVAPSSLSVEDKATLKQQFITDIFPVLTPLAIDPAHPFPFIPNRGLTLVLDLKEKESDKTMRALVPLPRSLKRFVKLQKTENTFVLLEDSIVLFLENLFPHYEMLAKGLFQVLRDSELEIDDEADDLMQLFEIALKRRRRGNVIQVTADADMPPSLRHFIVTQSTLQEQEIFWVSGLVALVDTEQLVAENMPALKFTPYNPRFPERIMDFHGNCFASIKHKDMLVHHPFESFDVVVLFLQQAAVDPDVLVIKQTLYRTSKDSPIVKALIQAAENGKQVTAVVELKARFDEEANIQWARDLERAGVQVVFGFLDLKTHAKVSLVVRKEDEVLQTYVHFGTGNYHPITAKVYTDLSFFTCDAAMGRDAVKLFNYLTGYAEPKALENLTLAPLQLRNTLLAHIDQEIQNAKAGKPAAIWGKLNALVDKRIIEKLYEASQAGVKIDLVVRGICCLRPQVPNLSENIRVRSIVGRFLEHARIVCFANGTALPSPQAKIFISSADWMSRNFDRRVESLVPLTNPTVHQQVLEQIMVANLKDNQQAWELLPDGSYVRIVGALDEQPFSAHEYFMHNPSFSGRGSGAQGEAPLLLL